LITWARAHYDHIVIDAPPLGLFSDALALAPLADSILLMARTGVSRKRMTQHTLGRFKETGMHNIGVVVNDVDFSKLNYGAYGAYAHYQKHYSAYSSGAEGA
jgi:Mrp family chromosome partitioning ATPase